jgi:hypothetical protein
MPGIPVFTKYKKLACSKITVDKHIKKTKP